MGWILHNNKLTLEIYKTEAFIRSQTSVKP